ncbi:hypothetical protein AAFF_G00279930 [Aldrovandia affinis]|uniref:Ig-like domain-containing protein n=1 Tax=Aldrovandia affinis TaxID=143900 RepID=A0AAD7SRC4_9TELE|nr:hypothetical protein AAFF_G00279930 [Aldrovandia affinis]
MLCDVVASERGLVRVAVPRPDRWSDGEPFTHWTQSVSTQKGNTPYKDVTRTVSAGHKGDLTAMGIPALLIACALLAGPGLAKRVVSVQDGPLVRTEGSHVTIWCNVTGYKEGVEQDFEWSIYLLSAPDREIRMVSTSQPNYAYSIYAQRVNRKEIYVERISGDSALLHIIKLEAKDMGQFECYTPNTDGPYLGSYSAKSPNHLSGSACDLQSPMRISSSPAITRPPPVSLSGRKVSLTTLTLIVLSVAPGACCFLCL